MLSFEAIENIEADKACRRVNLSQTVGIGGSGFGLLSFDPISDVKWCEYILFLLTVHIRNYVYI